jgi:phosphohistidine phosphatase
MDLYVVRHGIAGPVLPGQNDEARTLTAEGVDRMHQQARTLKQSGFHVDRLFTSPLIRARQTATVLALTLGVEAEVDVLLKPGCMLDDVAELLARHPHAGHVMLVGHQPDLGRLVYTLTGSNASMRTGMMAVINVQALRPSGGLLLGLYDPDVMARLAPA